MNDGACLRDSQRWKHVKSEAFYHIIVDYKDQVSFYCVSCT